jgi:transcription initiation factor TFIIIB Brf1 subunit/transcription initiation factor TFIIB
MKAARTKSPRYPGPTEAITEIASKIFGGHGTARDVARFTGVSHETIRTWIRKGREGDPRYVAFAAACDKGLTGGKLRAWKKAEDKDPRWVLVVRHGVKDKPTKVEHTGRDGKDLIPGREMTDAELIASVKALYTARHAKTDD